MKREKQNSTLSLLKKLIFVTNLLKKTSSHSIGTKKTNFFEREREKSNVIFSFFINQETEKQILFSIFGLLNQ